MATWVKQMQHRFEQMDQQITAWMARHGITLLRASVGIIYIWFGVIKFFPGFSPAESLASRTIAMLTFGAIPESTALYLLAAWETLIGLGLVFGVGLRLILLLLFAQMAGTITPMFFFPGEVFSVFPISPTLEGQYIIKNLVIISAALVIGATVRGGWLVSEPGDLTRTGHFEADGWTTNRKPITYPRAEQDVD